MSVFTLRASDFNDEAEDLDFMRGCRIVDFTVDEFGVTFVVDQHDEE